MGQPTDTSVDSDYLRGVGQRLRLIRNQKRLSLHEVEQASDKEFKASVLGAYERGERAISVPRLQRLAEIYRVPVDQLLPSSSDDTITLTDDLHSPGTGVQRSVTIDLRRLQELSGPDIELVRRFLNVIQVERQDFNGRMLTVRASDARAIACMLGVRPDAAMVRLDELGLSHSR